MYLMIHLQIYYKSKEAKFKKGVRMMIKDNREKPSNRSINNFRVLIVIKCSTIDKNLL